MATRLQFQSTETKTGSATPTQQAAWVETAVTPVPQTTTAPTTTRHTIEQELLGVRTRYVQSKTSGFLFIHGVCVILFIAITSARVLYREPEFALHIAIGTVMMLAIPGVALWWASWDDRRIARLLRTGDVYMATVTAIEKGANFSRVHATYVDKTGETMETVIKLIPEVIDREGLGPQSIFTLLLSPDNPKVMVPYFVASRRFRVTPVEATQVSRDVSHRIAAQIASHPVQSAGRLGTIEPELLGTTPRPVRMKNSHRRAMAWVYALVAIHD